MKEYLKFEKELRIKIEENAKLKEEIKDIKEAVKLNKLLKEKDAEIFINDEEMDIEDAENLSKNKNSGQRRSSPNFQSSPLKTNPQEREFNCPECFFRGTQLIELNNHINLKHTKGVGNEGNLKCRNCGDDFVSKWNLMNHRKNKHLENVAPCRNHRERRCPYSDDKCWWNHNENQQEQEEHFKCFFCGKTFKSKTELMSHRKREHGQAVKTCFKFTQNDCMFKDESCWFNHTIERCKYC